MTKVPTRVAVAICLVFAFGSAWADVSASVVLSEFSVALVDLDEADGIAPSIDFHDGNVSIFRLRVDSPAPPYIVSRYEHSDSIFGEGSATLVDGVSSSAASLVGDAFVGTAVLSAAVSTVGHGYGGQALLLFGYPNPNGNFDTIYFNLTPMTRLEISAVAVGDVAVSGSSGGGGSVQFSLELAQPDGGLQTGFASMSANARSLGLPTHASFMGPVTLSFENTSRLDNVGRFNGALNVSAYGVSAVPGPSSAALMMAGLAAAGLLKRGHLRLPPRRAEVSGAR